MITYPELNFSGVILQVESEVGKLPAWQSHTHRLVLCAPEVTEANSQ